MKVRSVILLALDAFVEPVRGKTLLMKRLFFMGVFLNEDYGYHAHYYGPYSEQVASELVTLKTQELVEERSLAFGIVGSGGFEVQRFDYDLTTEGRNAVQWLKQEYPEESGKIQEAAKKVLLPGKLDYVDLSIAAKAYFIVKESAAERITTQEIAAKARDFSWEVTEDQISQACRFLSELDLVKVS